MTVSYTYYIFIKFFNFLSAIKFSSTYFENKESDSHPALNILHRLSDASNELGTGVSYCTITNFSSVYHINAHPVLTNCKIVDLF